MYEQLSILSFSLFINQYTFKVYSNCLYIMRLEKACNQINIYFLKTDKTRHFLQKLLDYFFLLFSACLSYLENDPVSFHGFTNSFWSLERNSPCSRQTSFWPFVQDSIFVPLITRHFLHVLFTLVSSSPDATV